jgi:hypothetical protein
MMNLSVDAVGEFLEAVTYMLMLIHADPSWYMMMVDGWMRM